METAFTRLVGCRLPIQQAGMGGVAGPDLALAVSEAGGLGMLGGVEIPAPALAEILEGMSKRTDKPFGVNFLMPFLDMEAVEVAAARARVVEFFYGDPDPGLVEIVHQGGALAAWQVGSREEALAAEGAGVDLIVAQGVEAGGHVRGKVALLSLLEEVLDRCTVPVIASGGIGGPRSVAAVLAAGASAARAGTRFVAAEESQAHPAYVDALIGARAKDTVLTEAFSVLWPDAPHRVLRSAVEAATAFDGDVVGEMDVAGRTVKIERFSAEPPMVGTRGRIEAMALYAGESVGGVSKRQPAAEIVRELASRIE